MKEKVEALIEKIRPQLQADGGDIELIEVNNGVVKVKLTGACGTCPMSQITLKLGVESFIKENLPEIERVETV